MKQEELNDSMARGATLLAVYRVRSDGDGDFIAAFDICNCEARFGDNSGEGAERLATLVQDGLSFDSEASVWICFKQPSEIVDVLEGAQALWEKQHSNDDTTESV